MRLGQGRGGNARWAPGRLGLRVTTRCRFGTWRVAKRLRTLEGHTGWVNAVAITPDGRRAVSASRDQTLRLWDLESGQTLRTLEGHTESVSAVAVTPDGRRAVSGSYDETLRLWDLESGPNIAHARRPYGSVSAVAVTPDGLPGRVGLE